VADGRFRPGVLYVREDLLDRVVRRSQYGYYQTASMATHFLPYDSPGRRPSPSSCARTQPATLRWEPGERGMGGALHIIALHPQAGRREHRGLSPADAGATAEGDAWTGLRADHASDSRSALVTFAIKDATRIQERLKKGQRQREAQSPLRAPLALRLQRHGRHRSVPGRPEVMARPLLAS